MEEALEQASRVIEGEVPFTPHGAFLFADNWLAASDSQILQHEIISTPGWEGGGAAAHAAGVRWLSLQDELPPWAAVLAARLSSVLNGCAPDCCEVFERDSKPPLLCSSAVYRIIEPGRVLAGPCT